MNRRNILFAIGGVLVVGALVAANFYFKKEPSLTVTVEPIKTRDLEAIVSASGKIQPKRLVNIAAETTGRVVDLAVNEGDYVKAQSADPLVLINQTKPVRVSFAVPVDQVPLVQRYRAAHPRVLVHVPGADSSAALEGALVFADNAVDPASGTLLLKGEFPNKDGRLVPGQFVDVRLVLTEQLNALVVPSPAVTAGQQGTFVYVMNADSTVTPRNVSVLRSADEMAILSGGLKAGEQVVTDGQLRLSPGARVYVQKAAGATP